MPTMQSKKFKIPLNTIMANMIWFRTSKAACWWTQNDGKIVIGVVEERGFGVYWEITKRCQTQNSFKIPLKIVTAEFGTKMNIGFILSHPNLK